MPLYNSDFRWGDRSMGYDNKWYSSLFDIRTVTPEQSARNDKKLADYHKENMKGFKPYSGILGTLGFGTRDNMKSGDSRQDKAYEFFKKKGWTDEQSAGIVGNLLVETNGLDINAEGDGGKAYGIAQWHPDRQLKFKEVMGREIRGSTLEQQLEFVDWELNNGGPLEKKAGRNLRKATSASDAAFIVDDQYERSDGNSINKRISNANDILAGKEVSGARDSDNIEAGEYTEENKPDTNNFASIIDSLKSLPNTDTNFVGSIEEITKRNMINSIRDSAIKEEDRLNFGDLSNNDITSNDNNSPQSNIKKINGGTLDVINPNYNLPEYSILNSYLNFFGISDVPMNRSVMI
jgi:hypothetical protein